MIIVIIIIVIIIIINIISIIINIIIKKAPTLVQGCLPNVHRLPLSSLRDHSPRCVGLRNGPLSAKSLG